MDIKINIFMREIVKNNSKMLIRMLFLSLIYSILNILISFYFKIIIDDIIPSESISKIMIISVACIIVAIVKKINCILNIIHETIISRNIDFTITNTTYSKLISCPYSFFLCNNIGEIENKTRDSFMINTTVYSILSFITNDIIIISATSIVMIYINMSLYLICILFILFTTFISLIIFKPLESLNHKSREISANFGTLMFDVIYNIELIKAGKYDMKFANILKKRNYDRINSSYDVQVIENITTNIVSLLVELSEIALLWMGSKYVIEGILSLGQLITFYIMMSYILKPIERAFSIIPKIKTSNVIISRLDELFRNTDNVCNNDGNLYIEKIEDIKFEKVSFSYGENEILKDVTFSMKKRDKILLMGESGKGKTTIAKILIQLITSYQGSIFVNGLDLQFYNNTLLNSKISYMPQNNSFFTGSVISNITMFEENEMSDKLISLIELTKSDFIFDLCSNNKIIEENGANISGGQRKKISLIRALYKDFDLLILDEPTTGIDDRESEIIISHILSYFSDKMIIFISHKANLMKYFETVYYFDNAKITSNGYK